MPTPPTLALGLVLLVALTLIVAHVHHAYRPQAERFVARPTCNQFLGTNFVSQTKNPDIANCVYRFNDHAQFTRGATVGKGVDVADDIHVGRNTVNKSMALVPNVRSSIDTSKGRLDVLVAQRQEFESKLPLCANGPRTRESPGCYFCPSQSDKCTVNTRTPGATGASSGMSEDRLCGRPFCDHTQIINLASYTTYPKGVAISASAATALETQPAITSLAACRKQCQLHGADCKAVMYDDSTQDCHLKSGSVVGGGVGRNLQGSTVATKEQ